MSGCIFYHAGTRPFRTRQYVEIHTLLPAPARPRQQQGGNITTCYPY